jgi:hypothetical protein
LVGASITLVLTLAACGATVQPTVVQSPSPTPRTEPTAEEVTSALRFRTTFGLRSDGAWIRAVFNDPASDDGHSYGVPLLPDEVARVMAAQVAANAITDIVAAYGATVPEDWAGMFVDQQAGGTVVARFKANVAEHRSALLALLPVGAKVDVRSARWTDEELLGFIDRVEQERDWFPTIGTVLFTAEIAVLDNLVDARFDGRDPTAAGAIEAHYGNPPWLRAVWNGPGEWTGARGDIDVYTTDPAGRPVPYVDIELASVDPFLVDTGAIGWRTNKRGHLLRENMPAVAYRVRAFQWIGDERVAVGEALVTVPANGRTAIRLITK